MVKRQRFGSCLQSWVLLPHGRLNCQGVAVPEPRHVQPGQLGCPRTVLEGRAGKGEGLLFTSLLAQFPSISPRCPWHHQASHHCGLLELHLLGVWACFRVISCGWRTLGFHPTPCRRPLWPREPLHQGRYLKLRSGHHYQVTLGNRSSGSSCILCPQSLSSPLTRARSDPSSPVCQMSSHL